MCRAHFGVGIVPTAKAYPGRMWTAVAERSGDTAFSDAPSPPNVVGYPKAPSPLRSAGALHKNSVSLAML
jgi:hypothetical protein